MTMKILLSIVLIAIMSMFIVAGNSGPGTPDRPRLEYEKYYRTGAACPDGSEIEMCLVGEYECCTPKYCY